MTCHPGRYPHTTYPQTGAPAGGLLPLPDHTAGQPAHGSPCRPPALNPTASHTAGASGCRQLPDLITTNRTLLFLVLTCRPGRYPHTTHPHGWPPCCRCRITPPENRPTAAPCRPPALTPTASHTTRPNPAPGLPAPTRTPLLLVMTCRPGRYPQPVTLLAALLPLPDHTAGQPAHGCTLPPSGLELHRQPCRRAKPGSGASGCRQLPNHTPPTERPCSW